MSADERRWTLRRLHGRSGVSHVRGLDLRETENLRVMPVSEHEEYVAENDCVNDAFRAEEDRAAKLSRDLARLRDAARLVVDAEYRREQWGSDTEATFDRAIQGLRESLK